MSRSRSEASRTVCYRGRPLRSALVLGLGVTGQAVARVLARRGVSVLASDASDVATGTVDELTSLGVRVETGTHAEAAAALAGFDVVVPSPGISPHRGFLAEAVTREAPVVSELDLGQEMTAAATIGVTGTNGKTTTCRLAERILRASGREAYACGNTELPFLAAVDEHPDAEVFVVEASSFRLWPCETFRPRVAVFTSFAPDHLDWHASVEEYLASKTRLMARLGPDDLYVWPAEQPELAGLAPEGVPRLAFGAGRPSSQERAWADGDEIVVALGGRVVDARGAGELWERGPHFAADAAAAAAAAVFFGAGAEAIERGLTGFEPDAHRLAYVGELDGVRYYDDAVSTNPHATNAAVRTLSSVILLAGGLNKGLDVGALAETAGHLRAAVVFGQAAADLAAVLSGAGVAVEETPDLATAVEAARRRARPGDAVLLSPACASFDAYGGYAERGAEFLSLCRGLGVRL